MVDDQDKKKGGEYSELSDLFEDTGSAPSLDDLLKDLGADLDDVPSPEKKKKSSKKKETLSNPEYDALFSDSPVDTTLPPKQSKEGVPTGAEFDALFADTSSEPTPPPTPTPTPKVEKTTTGTDFDALFSDTKPKHVEKNLFEDMNVDFPESKPGQDLGHNALFDYEPQSEASMGELGGAENDLNHTDMGGETPPPPKKGVDVKRIVVRLGVMVLLAVVVYSGLKFFLGKKHTEMMAMPHAPMVSVPPIAAVPAPVPAPQAAPTPEAAPSPVQPQVTEAAPQNLPVPGAVSSGLPSTQPVMTIPSTGMATEMVSPQAAAPVPVTVSTTQPAATQPVPTSPVSLGTGDVNEKLDKLEMALQSIDQRLAQVSAGGMTETQKAQRLERIAGESNAPEMQASIDTAVKKMQTLDKKLDRLNELQKQVRMLNKEVQSMKEDIVTQTNIVGQQQRAINDNTKASNMNEMAPVKMMVQAVIPGRAWLRSERGELLTVIPGDEVPGYGRVVSIDAQSGSVVTSSRVVFREQ